VTVTPHVAWYSVAARHELAIKSAEEALRWLDTGAARHPVNRP
jgi:lactate dehydrogenase-like 2-hydroxyacid dehydrogenase